METVMSKQEQIQRELEVLRAAVPEVRGVLVASTEGLPIAHSFVNGADPQRLAAMSAAASSLGRRISESLNAGSLMEVSVAGSEGHIFVYSAGTRAVLAVVGPAGANAGLIHLEARDAAKAILEIFGP
ncbi:MAG TPA: roadblock/LC7 domain-containing protein [Bryobacteraceae bacterium]|nr:roadblock/LC7 domain-containing protein [Bryobacteraceae bacterium]